MKILDHLVFVYFIWFGKFIYDITENILFTICFDKKEYENVKWCALNDLAAKKSTISYFLYSTGRSVDVVDDDEEETLLDNQG